MAQAILSESLQEMDSSSSAWQKNGDPPQQQQQQFLRSSKKRADNYSRKDKEKLIELVNSRLDILENKIANSGVNLQKANCWMEIANQYNQGRTTASDYWRDDRQLKDLWKRMKFTARADLIRYARQKEKNTTRNNDDSNVSSSSIAHEILDDFTVILLRLVPAHFQMDTDGKVLQVIDEFLALSPAEVEKQKLLSRNRRQQRRQQMTGHFNNQDDDDDDDDDACVLLEVNNGLDNSPDNDPVMILESCLPPPQCPTNNPNRSSATGTPVATSSEMLISNSPQENNFYTDSVVVTPKSTTTVPGGISHRSQLIDVDRGIENGQIQRQPQTSSSHPLLPPQPPPPPLEQQQQAMLHEEPMFTFKTENDTDMNEAVRQSWYIEQIGSRNQYEDIVNNPAAADPERDYQYRRKRKTPFYRSLLEDDRSEEMRHQLVEMARKENEKEMQLLDIQTQCEKQRLVREKMETENAVLKQRLLLQMLQSQINKDQGLPSVSLLL